MNVLSGEMVALSDRLDAAFGRMAARFHAVEYRFPPLIAAAALEADGQPVARHGRRDGDLTTADPFAGVGPGGITSIVHSAATTSFTVDRETARAVNVEGTRKALDFAARCPDLRSFTLVSTIYASGLRAGAIPEEASADDAAGFANWYEWSKYQAERLTVGSGLPWRVARVATVIADDPGGRVAQFNAFHNTLRLCFYGLLSVLPGNPATPLHLVTGAGAADAVAALAGPDAPGGVHHIVDRPLGLGTLVDLAFAAFNEDEGFRSRRLLPPLFADEETFELLRQGAASGAGDVVRQAIDSVAPFARQLYVAKMPATGRLGRPVADTEAVVAATCRWLVRTRWGRRADAA